MKVTDVFESGESVLTSDVQCNGTENNISQCLVTGNGIDTHTCDKKNRAGVICIGM